MEPAHAWGVLGLGIAVLLAVPPIYASQHSGSFRWWWPTDWMALPLVLCAVGITLLLVPLRRSVASIDQQKDETEQSPPDLLVEDEESSAQALNTSGLPARTTTFVGRNHELELLLDCLNPAGGEGAPVTVSSVSGLGGVGKTELALQAAYAAQSLGWFPGGVLFINLFGYAPERRVPPGPALDRLLRALGIPKENIPAAIEDRAALYAAALKDRAARGHKVLVVIDNAQSAEQVELLLPPPSAGRAVITSRHILAELGARLIELRPLEPEDATALLAEKLRQANGLPDARMRDSGATRDLADLCGGLPLALQITGANLAADRSKSLRQMASDLEDRKFRLDEMQYGALAVRPMFDLSYRALTGDQQRLFRILTVNTGPDIATDTAAAIAEEDRRQVRHQLEALSKAHLVEGSAGGRWRMHDLVRLYAEELERGISNGGQKSEAEERLLHYYQNRTRAAVDWIWHEQGPGTNSVFANSRDAVSWLKDEHSNLTAAVVNSGERYPDIALKISFPLSVFLSQWRFFDECLSVGEIALRLARELNSEDAIAGALDNLGIALHQVGRETESLRATKEAVVLYRRLASSDPVRYERQLGRALANFSGRDEAPEGDRLSMAKEAVEIGKRWATDPDHANPDVELAGALHNLGSLLSALGQHSEAVMSMREAVEIRRIQGKHSPARYQPFLGNILTDLSSVLSKAERYDEALSAAREAVVTFRILAAEDPVAHGPALIMALERTQKICESSGRTADARAAADEAARVLHLINSQS